MLRDFRIDIRANTDPTQMFSVSKTEKRPSELTGTLTVGEIHIQVSGVTETSQSGDLSYLRLCFTFVKGATRHLYYGSLFENTHKNPASKQPDFTGTLRADPELRIAGWQRFDSPGDEATGFIAVHVSEPRKPTPSATPE